MFSFALQRQAPLGSFFAFAIIKMPLSISCLYYTICDIEKAKFVAEFVAEFFSISATMFQNTEKSFIQPQ